MASKSTNRRFTVGVAIALVFFLGGVRIVAVHSEEAPPVTSYKDSEISINVLPRIDRPLKGEGNSVVPLFVPGDVFVAVKKPNEKERTVALPEGVMTVDEIRRVAGSKLAVIAAEYPANIKDVLVYDKDMRQLLDEFWCYIPTISPNGAFVAFTEFFPAHFAYDEEASNNARIYELKLGAAANGGVDAESPGFQVYPTNFQIAAQARAKTRRWHEFLQAQYFWSQDSSKFVLLDEQNVSPLPRPKSGREHVELSYQFVMVDLASVPPRVGVIPVDVCEKKSEYCRVQLRDAEFSDTGVTVTVEGLGPIHQPMNLKFDQFVPIE